MTPLSKEFLDACPEEQGFRLRGLEMTRIEVFVDAAFAFAVTMLVISFDAIPESFEEMVVAIKGIPAFIIAVAQLVWIWYEHNVWSKRFGLENAMTVFLSTLLLVVMLIYVYPMKIMAAGMFSWFTDDYLPVNFLLTSYQDLTDMFIFLSIGFSALCLVFVLLYRHALGLKVELGLSDKEVFRTKTVLITWAGAAGTGVLCIMAAVTLPDALVPFSGFAFALLGIWIPLIQSRRQKLQARIFSH